MPNEQQILSESDLTEIEKRVAKVPEGPWFAASDPAKECGPHRDSGLALVDTGRESDWPIARLCEWHKARFIAASITDIPALCHTVRALRADAKAEMERESKLVTDLEETVAALRDQLAQQRETIELLQKIPAVANAALNQTLGQIQDDAATRMRDACVTHLRATADALDVRQEIECPSGTAFNSEATLRRHIATELSSLTLDQVEKKQ